MDHDASVGTDIVGGKRRQKRSHALRRKKRRLEKERGEAANKGPKQKYVEQATPLYTSVATEKRNVTYAGYTAMNKIDEDAESLTLEQLLEKGFKLQHWDGKLVDLPRPLHADVNFY